MRLQTLRLSNFQGIKQLQLDFDGHSAAIYGRNGIGKTTVYNAFTWLLTGKSSTDSKGFNPKTNDSDGGEVHNLDHSAEAVLSLDNGQLVTLKKVYHEVYKKKRGHATADFSGNTIDYYINGVPTKEKDYDTFVLEQLGGEENLKMITMPDYFLQKLDPKKRRKALADLFGNLSDEEIIQSDDALRDLPRFLQIPGSDGQLYSVPEYRKIAAARKAEINDRLSKLPERIDEATNAIPDDADGCSIEEIRARIREVDAHICLLEDRRAALNSDTASAQVAKQTAEATAKLEQARGIHQSSENTRLAAKRKELQALLDQASNMRRDSARAVMEADFLGDKRKRMEQAREKLLQEWAEINSKAWSPESEICPTCGQRLPEDRIAQLRGDFNQKKSQILMQITEQGQRECSQEMLLKLQMQIEEQNQIARTSRENADGLDKQAEELRNTICEVPFESTDEYQQMKANLDALSQRALEIQSDLGLQNQRVDLDRRIADRKDARNALQNRIFGIQRAEIIRERIRLLEQEERDLAAEFEQVENGLYLCELFVRQQVRLIDERINGHFKTIRFKLFKEQNNGGIADCCEALVPSENGALVPYPDANNAAKVNSGLETIGVLAEQLGISAPVFIDNAESVTDIQTVNAQVIRLVVSKDDDQLRLEVNDE